MGKISGKMAKSGKSEEKWGKVVEIGEKWWKVIKSGEKWRKVAKVGGKWEKVRKMGKSGEKVEKSGYSTNHVYLHRFSRLRFCVWCILTSHITHSNGYAPCIGYYRSNAVDQLFRKLKQKPKLNPPNAHRSQIKICENRQTQSVQFPFMPNAFRILKPIQKSSKRVWVFRSTGANAFAKNQMRLAYEDKRDLYCRCVYMWFYVAKSGSMWLNVVVCGSKYVLPKR